MKELKVLFFLSLFVSIMSFEAKAQEENSAVDAQKTEVTVQESGKVVVTAAESIPLDSVLTEDDIPLVSETSQGEDLIAIEDEEVEEEEEKVWTIGLGVNAIDVTPFGLGDAGNQIKDYLGEKDWESLSVLSSLYVTRNLNYGLVADIAFSLNSIDLLGKGDKTYFSIDLGVRYDLNELIGDTTQWFDPYVKLGVGTAWTDGDGLGLIVSPSYGFNTWINDTIGLNLESSYRSPNITGTPTKVIPSGYYFQHSFSLVIKIIEE